MKSRDRDGDLAGYDVPSPYDLRITDKDGNHYDLMFHKQGGWAFQSERPALPGSSSQPTSDSGEFYDVRDANDYYRIVQGDWSEGAGQKSRDEAGSTAARFDDGRNIDTMTPGQIELGPATLSYTTDAGQIGNICIAAQKSSGGEPLVVAGFDTAPVVRYSADNITWTGWELGTVTPSTEPVDFCDDGETLYVAFGDTSYHVWAGNIAGGADFAEWTQEDNITKLAYVAGTLYGAKGSSTADAELGTFTMTGGAPHAWTKLPTHPITHAGTTIGLCPGGTSVYWGVQIGVRSYVYRVQAETDTFESFAEFPAGFIARCMYPYMGNIYVGGYYDGPEKDNGRGAIYVCTSMGSALLTDIGEPIGDWRVESISAYEKSLYFISNGSVWRWDLVKGGYSHWSSIGVLSTETTLSYDWTEAMSSEPASPSPWTKTTVGTGTAAVDTGVLEFSCPADSDSVTYTRSHSGTATAGCTVDFTIPADTAREGYFFVKLDDNSSKANLYLRGHASRSGVYRNLEMYLDNAAGTKRYVATVDNLVANTIRMTLRNDKVKLYGGETLLYESSDIPNTAGSKTISFGAERGDGFGASSFSLDSIALDDDGAFDYESGTSPDGTIACMRDCVWVAVPETALLRIGHYTGNSKTESCATSGWVLHSKSTARMSTVSKHFVYADVILAEALPAEASLKVQVSVDGTSLGIVSLVQDGDSDLFYTAKLPSNGNTGKEVQAKLLMETTGASPVVTHFSLRFTPLGTSSMLHAFTLDLIGRREDNNGRLYDFDPATTILALQSLVNQVVEVEYGGLYFEGKVESVEGSGHPATPHNDSPLSGTMKLVIRELW